jgi:hypothetical protein
MICSSLCGVPFTPVLLSSQECHPGTVSCCDKSGSGELTFYVVQFLRLVLQSDRHRTQYPTRQMHCPDNGLIVFPLHEGAQRKEAPAQQQF